LTPEHWVEKLPIGIDEKKAIGSDNALMRAYETANAKAYNGKQTKKVDEPVGEPITHLSDGGTPMAAANHDDKDDDFK
jgi:hypothetical protein